MRYLFLKSINMKFYQIFGAFQSPSSFSLEDSQEKNILLKKSSIRHSNIQYYITIKNYMFVRIR